MIRPHHWPRLEFLSSRGQEPCILSWLNNNLSPWGTQDWYRQVLPYHLDPIFPMTHALEKSASGQNQLMPWTPHFLGYLWYKLWLRPELIYHPDPTFSMFLVAQKFDSGQKQLTPMMQHCACSLQQRSLTQARAYLIPGPNISDDPRFSEVWPRPELTYYPDQTFPMPFVAQTFESGQSILTTRTQHFPWPLL